MNYGVCDEMSAPSTGWEVPGILNKTFGAAFLVGLCIGQHSPEKQNQ